MSIPEQCSSCGGFCGKGPCGRGQYTAPVSEDTDKERLDCCEYYQEGMDKINAPIILATIRAGHRTYDGKPFNYCPWCGKATYSHSS